MFVEVLIFVAFKLDFRYKVFRHRKVSLQFSKYFIRLSHFVSLEVILDLLGVQHVFGHYRALNERM